MADLCSVRILKCLSICILVFLYSYLFVCQFDCLFVLFLPQCGVNDCCFYRSWNICLSVHFLSVQISILFVCLFVYLFLFLPWYGIGDLCFVHILKCNDLDCPCSNQIRILSQLERWRIESIRPEASCTMELFLNLLGERPGIRPLLHKQGRAENMESY